jgi:hypothetical protein
MHGAGGFYSIKVLTLLMSQPANALHVCDLCREIALLEFLSKSVNAALKKAECL